METDTTLSLDLDYRNVIFIVLSEENYIQLMLMISSYVRQANHIHKVSPRILFHVHIGLLSTFNSYIFSIISFDQESILIYNWLIWQE